MGWIWRPVARLGELTKSRDKAVFALVPLRSSTLLGHQRTVANQKPEGTVANQRFRISRCCTLLFFHYSGLVRLHSWDIWSCTPLFMQGRHSKRPDSAGTAWDLVQKRTRSVPGPSAAGELLMYTVVFAVSCKVGWVGSLMSQHVVLPVDWQGTCPAVTADTPSAMSST